MKDKKDIIIEAAIGLFAQKGFTSTSIHEIAKASNIQKELSPSLQIKG
ncbi:TetR family transcriptional regulator [Anaerobacillus sp. HL2]|nr:TetR family transcriptional regulator [Anaerobacillus sp. HL2]